MVDIFHHTKMLIIKRKGQTMGEHYTKIIRHNNVILGHKKAAIDGQYKSNLRTNQSFNSKRQFDIMSNHFDFDKTILVTLKTTLSEIRQVNIALLHASGVTFGTILSEIGQFTSCLKRTIYGVVMKQSKTFFWKYKID